MMDFLWNARHFGLRLAVGWRRSKDDASEAAVARAERLRI
jgi:hypothetical protein